MEYRPGLEHRKVNDRRQRHAPRAQRRGQCGWVHALKKLFHPQQADRTNPLAPTLVFDRQSGELVAAVGSPGGSQIIEYVSKSLVAMLDWQLDPQAAISLPNFGSRHGATELETGLFSPALKQALRDTGHALSEVAMTSGVQAIVRTRDAQGKVLLSGGADPRREGEALGD